MGDTESGLPPHIEETIRAIGEVHADHQRAAGALQRAVNRMTRSVARPRFFGLLVLLAVGWIALNAALQLAGRAAPDPAPFYLLANLCCLLGLGMTVLILITQRHENELGDYRQQLTLQLAMLGEQKSAKIIRLLEELRRDLPMIADRHDPEAEALSAPADPQTVLEAIKETQEEMLASVDAVVSTELPLPQNGRSASLAPDRALKRAPPTPIIGR